MCTTPAEGEAARGARQPCLVCKHATHEQTVTFWHREKEDKC